MAAVVSLACSHSHSHSHSASFSDFSSLALNPSTNVKFSKNIKLQYHRLPSYSSFSPGDKHKAKRCFSASVNKREDDSEDEVQSVGVKAALSMLNLYKREISPLLPKSCRYVPSCSEYSMIAYKKYGVVKGTVLTAWRLCRCNPLGGSGFDPPRWFDEEKVSEEQDL